MELSSMIIQSMAGPHARLRCHNSKQLEEQL